MLSKENILQQTRRMVRYHLYRIRTSEEGGASHKSKALKEYYEAQKGFAGWRGFARVWDLDEEGEHHRIVKRQSTEEQEWNYMVNSLAEELPWSKR